MRGCNYIVAKVRAWTNDAVVIFENCIFSKRVSDNVTGAAVFEQNVLAVIGVVHACSTGHVR